MEALRPGFDWWCHGGKRTTSGPPGMEEGGDCAVEGTVTQHLNVDLGRSGRLFHG